LNNRYDLRPETYRIYELPGQPGVKEDDMAWDFETDPEFQKKLDWIEDFMRDEVEPLSHLGMAAHGPLGREKFIKPLQQKVKDQGLWACHLGPELGGQGFGQLKLGLMN
jgi:acyl-CoA dehydrogenase